MSRSLTVLVIALGCLVVPATAAAAGNRPRVTGFSFSPASFAAPAPGAATGARAQRVTTIHFILSRRATVRISIMRKLRGRRSHGRCVKPTKALRNRRACTRHVFRGALKRRSDGGQGTIGFTGILRRRGLVPGTYRATIIATDRNDRRSRRKTATFRVTRATGGHPPGTPPAPGPAPSPTPPGGFPSATSVGVPAGWVPAQTLTSDLIVRQAGAVIQDVLMVNASISVEAPNVTVRRVKVQGGKITNRNGNPCHGGMLIEDSTLEPAPGEDSSIETEGVVDVGGYTARRVKIWRRAEGFRTGADCGPVRIEDSFAKIVIPDGRCDLHSDGIQGYGGPWATVINTTIDFVDAWCGTAPFFIPKNQGNTGATVDRLLVMGGGYPFRMGVPGTVSGLKIVNGSWIFGPIDVACSLITKWDASIVTITPDYQVASTVKNQPCNTETGN